MQRTPLLAQELLKSTLQVDGLLSLPLRFQLGNEFFVIRYLLLVLLNLILQPLDFLDELLTIKMH